MWVRVAASLHLLFGARWVALRRWTSRYLLNGALHLNSNATRVHAHAHQPGRIGVVKKDLPAHIDDAQAGEELAPVAMWGAIVNDPDAPIAARAGSSAGFNQVYVCG